MKKQTRGVFFLVLGVLFLNLIFTKKGQDIWNILVGRALVIGNSFTDPQTGQEKYIDPNGTPMFKSQDGKFYKSYERPPEFGGKPWIPSTRDTRPK